MNVWSPAPNGTLFSFMARPRRRQFSGNNSVIRFRAPTLRHWTGLALARPAPIATGQASKTRRTPFGALFETEPKRKTLLVGHSYGAPVALLAALKFTNQVAGVVLIGGSIDPAQERIYAIQRFADWPLVSWLVPRSLRQCNRELLTLRDDLVCLQPQLSKIAVPVVMLQGGKDRQVPVSNVDYLRAQLAAAGKTNLFGQLVFPDYNHFIPWEHPDAVEAAIRMVTGRLSRTAQNQ